MRLTLKDWTDADERRFERRKWRIMKAIIKSEWNKYDTDTYHNPNLLCGRASVRDCTTQQTMSYDDWIDKLSELED